ncbi:class I SAM-dependent methyltransferase [Microlunatus parietis]|uniref:SAM-dependent methyltransferase n=1 Tax=Microlunatus parietis TaxID=682979 RepID=A0A7Y9I2A8_9ACTN|nr:class I SAM-dependent methyltransferase [Microlunatus parietis]NYE68691.1 SAM-dependent methyltransferase [Microlunatus parietis]
MDLGFGGEISDLYHRFRRGYPPELFRAIAVAFSLRDDDLVVDLGCGTGQLAAPMAQHVRAVLAVDPEPDMLARARTAATEQGITNIGWLVGRDSDLPLLRTVLGDQSVAAVTIGQALHWMDHATLFTAVGPLLRPGGGIVVVSNGIPLWLQDSDWSRALRGWLQNWFGTRPANSCGTDELTRQRYRESLIANGFDVSQVELDYTDELDFDHLIGGIYSALPVDRLPPPPERARFAASLREALDPFQPYLEYVPVRAIFGTKITADPVSVTVQPAAD